MAGRVLVFITLGVAVLADPGRPPPDSPTATCSSSPFFQDLLFCDRRNRPPSAATADDGPANSTRPGGTRDPWTGPLACAGAYCVYANPSFEGGRGLSLITTAQVARDVGALPGFAAAAAAPASLNNNADLVGQADGPAPFRVQAIPGKGLGLVATRPIRRGHAIMAHTPVVLAHLDIISKMATADQHRLLDAAVAQLPARTRAAYMAQAASAGGHAVADVMHTNAFGLNLGVAGAPRHFANFPEVSRFNHDCRPNVAYYTTPLLQHVTHATRAIAAGEELTISYVDATRARAVRQERCRRSWGFRCTCAHCALPPPLANASDFRLAEMYEAEARLADWGSAGAAGAVEDTVEMLLALYEQEGLRHGHAANAYVLAALNFNSLGRAEKARQYASLGLEQSLLQAGPWGDDVAVLLDVLREPRAHWSWRRRLGEEGGAGSGFWSRLWSRLWT